MIRFIPLPGSDEAANDNGEHRPPDFRDVMQARQQLAQIARERSADLSFAWLRPKGHA